MKGTAVPHTHDDCTYPQYGDACTSGMLTGVCEYEECSNEYCVNLGHCNCKCHSGKTCYCGHMWEKDGSGKAAHEH